jgi:predicted dehydrogenase
LDRDGAMTRGAFWRRSWAFAQQARQQCGPRGSHLDMTLRWGILGASSKIYRKALLPVFEASPLHEVVAEASRSGQDETPYGDVLTRSDVDAIYIPLPNHIHASWIVRALEAGKHVLCEKPLTLTLAESEQIFAAAETTDRWLIEAYTWPHHPRSQRVLELAATGALAYLSWSVQLHAGRSQRSSCRSSRRWRDVGYRYLRLCTGDVVGRS